MATFEERLDRIREIVSEPFRAGTQVTNCVVHMNLPLDQRPEDCRLCRPDIVNQLRRAIRVNEWLKERLEKVRQAVNPEIPL